MKKGYDVGKLADVQAAQNVANREYSKAQRQNYFKAGRDFIAGQDQRKRLLSNSAQSLLDAQSATDPSVKAAYQREAQALKMLADQSQYLDPEKYDEAFYTMMRSIEDPRKLANELRKIQMQNEAEILKARIYAGAQGGNNKKYEDLVIEAQARMAADSEESATSPDWIQRTIGGLSTLFPTRQPQAAPVSTYQSQPMPQMQTLPQLPESKGEGVFQPSYMPPSLWGGFSR